ncbi:MAG: hypothetical protein R3194_00490 [Limnobacter sp.]|nr:hypothetical protein [Limnobacter sp.]
MHILNTEQTNGYYNLARQDRLFIEPLVIHPLQFTQLLSKLQVNQRPVSMLELQRLGVPRFATRWLLSFANDTISEAELVRAFVLHLTSRQEARKTAYELFKRFLPQANGVLNNPALSMDERLVLHSLNMMAGPLTDSWFDLTGPATDASCTGVLN